MYVCKLFRIYFITENWLQPFLEIVHSPATGAATAYLPSHGCYQWNSDLDKSGNWLYCRIESEFQLFFFMWSILGFALCNIEQSDDTIFCYRSLLYVKQDMYCGNWIGMLGTITIRVSEITQFLEFLRGLISSRNRPFSWPAYQIDLVTALHGPWCHTKRLKDLKYL